MFFSKLANVSDIGSKDRICAFGKLSEYWIADCPMFAPMSKIVFMLMSILVLMSSIRSVPTGKYFFL